MTSEEIIKITKQAIEQELEIAERKVEATTGSTATGDSTQEEARQQGRDNSTSEEQQRTDVGSVTARIVQTVRRWRVR